MNRLDLLSERGYGDCPFPCENLHRECVMSVKIAKAKVDVKTNGRQASTARPELTLSADWKWPPEVLDFAKQAGVSEYLEPLLKAIRELVPEARALRVMVDVDREIEKERHIAWEFDILFPGVDSYLKLQRRLIEALCALCPAPLTSVFCLLLLPHGST
jgi:hypothetical protein